MADVDDRAVGLTGRVVASADQEAGDVLDRRLRGRQADAHRRHARSNAVQPLQRQGQMANRACRGPGRGFRRRSRSARRAASRGSRAQVSSRYSDSGVVTRMCGGWRSIAWRCAAGVSPVRTAARIGGSSVAGSSGRGPDLGQRHFQVAVNVVGQGLERRDIDDLRFVGQSPARALSKQPIEAGTERRPASCPSRSGRRSACAFRRRSRASPTVAARSARQTVHGTIGWSEDGTTNWARLGSLLCAWVGNA